MTSQISDTFIYKGDQFTLVGIQGGDLFLPEQYGLQPEMIHTACYRGFYGKYELTEESLTLKGLTIREKSGNYVSIDGVMPTIGRSFDQATYKDLNLIVTFSGRLRLAKDFIEALYIHMGYQKATAFKTVLDITIEEGKVVEIKDRSKEVEQKRGDFKKRYESEDLAERINQAFSLDLEFE